jgi:hypothetical protein
VDFLIIRWGFHDIRWDFDDIRKKSSLKNHDLSVNFHSETPKISLNPT